MAVNPVSKNTYLTVSRGRRAFQVQWQLPNDVATPSVLLRITPAGEISEVRLDNVRHSFADISKPPSETADAPDWKKGKLRRDTISASRIAGATRAEEYTPKP